MVEETEQLIDNSKEKIGTNYINDHTLTILANDSNRILEDLCFSIVNYKVEVEKLNKAIINVLFLHLIKRLYQIIPSSIKIL